MTYSDLKFKSYNKGAWPAGVSGEGADQDWADATDDADGGDCEPADEHYGSHSSDEFQQDAAFRPPAAEEHDDGPAAFTGDGQDGSGNRRENLISQGRASAPKPPRHGLGGPTGWITAARSWMTRRNLIIAAAGASLLIILVAIVLPGGDPSWPASVATVKQEIVTSCQNPNVSSDPGQVNVACGKDTSAILWVFALLDSKDNPKFTGTAGRKGLEPITPAQGGEVALALDLHHPYNPLSPTDSLAVAARAINNIIGGATIIDSSGKQVVEPGLESSAANCQRYTGSSALVTRAGFPALCAKPVTTSGAALLAADVYRQWMPDASATDVNDAKTLFANAANPGQQAVQAILRDRGLQS